MYYELLLGSRHFQGAWSYLSSARWVCLNLCNCTLPYSSIFFNTCGVVPQVQKLCFHKLKPYSLFCYCQAKSRPEYCFACFACCQGSCFSDSTLLSWFIHLNFFTILASIEWCVSWTLHLFHTLAGDLVNYVLPWCDLCSLLGLNLNVD